MITTNDIEAHTRRVSAAFAALHAATKAAFTAAEDVRDADLNLRIAKQKIINDYAVDPKALGSNEETRKAKVAELTQAEADQLWVAENLEREARHALELARIEHDAARAHTGLLDQLVRSGAVVMSPAGTLDGLDNLPSPPAEKPKTTRARKGSEKPAAIPDSPNDGKARSIHQVVTESSSEVSPDGKWANDLDHAKGEVRPAPPSESPAYQAWRAEREAAGEAEHVDPFEFKRLVDAGLVDAAKYDADPLAGEPVVINWKDDTTSHGTVTRVDSEAGMVTVDYEDDDKPGSGTATLPADMVSAATPESAERLVVTIEQQQELSTLFAAAGMGPLKIHEFLTGEYPGMPVTLDTLGYGHYLALVPILKGKAETLAVKQAPPPAPEPEAPAAEEDPQVTVEQADELRVYARQHLPTGDVRAKLAELGVETMGDLRVSQYVHLRDVVFPDLKASLEVLPF